LDELLGTGCYQSHFRLKYVGKPERMPIAGTTLDNKSWLLVWSNAMDMHDGSGVANDRRSLRVDTLVNARSGDIAHDSYYFVNFHTVPNYK
jgi:hypothetical protein